MRIRLIVAMLLCALLLGCGTVQDPGQTPPNRLSPTKQTENDNLRIYPMDAANCRFLAFEKDLLLLRPGENATLSRYCGKGLTLSAWTQVPRNAVLCAGDGKPACFDPDEKMLFLYADDLTLLECSPLPGCLEPPRLLGEKAYYCTRQALMEYDMETGLNRTVRQQEGLSLSALLRGESLAVCALEGSAERLCIRLSDGALALSAPEILAAEPVGNRERLALQLGFRHCLYLGQTELILPAGWDFLAFVPSHNGVLLCQPGNTLGIYDLSTGNCMASRALPDGTAPEDVSVTQDARVFFRCGTGLYQWEPVIQFQRDSSVRITPLHTPLQPDAAGLEQCRQRGSYLENQYGIHLLLNTDAAQIAPKGCSLEPEHLRPVILDVLSGVETALSRFPTALVKAAFSGKGQTFLCPVRSIRVAGQMLPALQFWSGQDCYLVVAASDRVEETALEAFLPLIDRQVLMHSDAFDVWNAESPETGETERCALLFQAMQPDRRELFLDAVQQNRLRTLSIGIRAAFSLEATETLLWEQYLWTPIRT